MRETEGTAVGGKNGCTETRAIDTYKDQELIRAIKTVLYAACWIAWAATAFVTAYLAIYGVGSVLMRPNVGGGYWVGMVIGFYGLVGALAYALWRGLQHLLGK